MYIQYTAVLYSYLNWNLRYTKTRKGSVQPNLISAKGSTRTKASLRKLYRAAILNFFETLQRKPIRNYYTKFWGLFKCAKNTHKNSCEISLFSLPTSFPFPLSFYFLIFPLSSFLSPPFLLLLLLFFLVPVPFLLLFLPLFFFFFLPFSSLPFSFSSFSSSYALFPFSFTSHYPPSSLHSPPPDIDILNRGEESLLYISNNVKYLIPFKLR
jgi:hypothetical protein